MRKIIIATLAVTALSGCASLEQAQTDCAGRADYETCVSAHMQRQQEHLDKVGKGIALGVAAAGAGAASGPRYQPPAYQPQGYHVRPTYPQIPGGLFNNHYTVTPF